MIGYWLAAFYAENYVNLHSIYGVQGTPAVIFVFWLQIGLNFENSYVVILDFTN